VTLPVLISVPHPGLLVPPQVRDLCLLTPDQIREDSDEGAAEIYGLKSEAAAFTVGARFGRPRSDNVVKAETHGDGAVTAQTHGVKRGVVRAHRPGRIIH